MLHCRTWKPHCWIQSNIALAEDIGTGDLTSLFFIPETRRFQGANFREGSLRYRGGRRRPKNLPKA